MANSPYANGIRIAILETTVANQQKQLNRIEEKVDELMTIMNRGRGAYAASMAIATGVGALLLELIHSAGAIFHR